MSNIHLSVIIPAYNEAKRIRPTLLSCLAYLATQSYAHEIIVVLNNCTDNTKEILEELRSAHPSIQILDLGMIYSSSNTKGYAVREGMLKATGDYRFYLDADNAAPLSEIEILWPYIKEGIDVVFGSRYLKGSHLHVSWYRRILSRGANLLIQVLLLPGVRDTQCAFKLFTQEAAVKIFTEVRTISWGFDMEVLFLARYFRFKSREVPIDWDEVGGSSVKAKAFFTSLGELMAIRQRAWKGIYGKRKTT